MPYQHILQWEVLNSFGGKHKNMFKTLNRLSCFKTKSFLTLELLRSLFGWPGAGQWFAVFTAPNFSSYKGDFPVTLRNIPWPLGKNLPAIHYMTIWIT